HEELDVFPEAIEAQLKGIARTAASSDAMHREQVLLRRRAAMVDDPAKFAALRAAAEANYAARAADFHAKAARHGLTPILARRAALDRRPPSPEADAGGGAAPSGPAVGRGPAARPTPHRG